MRQYMFTYTAVLPNMEKMVRDVQVNRNYWNKEVNNQGSLHEVVVVVVC